MAPGTIPSSSSSWKPARVRFNTKKRVHVNGIATSRKVARVEGRGRPSLKSNSNSEEENASFEVDEGTGVPSSKSSLPATKPQQPPPPPIDSPLPSDVSLCHGSKRKKRKTSTRTNASSSADTNRQFPPKRRLRKARVGGKSSDNPKNENLDNQNLKPSPMALRVRSKGARKSRVRNRMPSPKSISLSKSKLPCDNISISDQNILAGGQGSNWELSSFERGKSISDSCKPQPLKFSDQQNVIAGGQRSSERGGKSISGSSKPQPLENICIDEASPKSGSPVTEPQQPLNDEEEDLSYMNSHLTFEQMVENMKKVNELALDESESESEHNGMQCNCDFNNCTCLKSYYEYLALDYAELDFSLR
ncbi:hypothetical protein MtrunA17_Chr5g0427741 [Medicago truncatula]|uniref:Uncharacterized protein n=1 Tax=Medicago truncatula TaxID=3880 RepID=G7JYG4_MEDTR|nr:uncharacterized protein LOC11433696 isoform X2 [Medicago truncatula]AES98284.1 hypothetical protein MTR_5g066610 [Medicago truncatula]RHN56280.1 hypothetical protein MtrunA17_Chr5g0427741 [Medicago truncatula]